MGYVLLLYQKVFSSYHKTALCLFYGKSILGCLDFRNVGYVRLSSRAFENSQAVTLLYSIAIVLLTSIVATEGISRLGVLRKNPKCLVSQNSPESFQISVNNMTRLLVAVSHFFNVRYSQESQKNLRVCSLYSAFI